ncbi:MAG: NACHT domain-containing protein [Nostoc sp.]|uniref:NACHT domain-containing protein n=1 Tax=Nostoc sp. TaxID=1180 RepID=UPI002FF18CE0
MSFDKINLNETQKKLTEFLVSSGFCALDQREILCLDIGVEANKHSFFNNPNNSTFAHLLVNHLFESEKKNSLLQLFEKLEKEFDGEKKTELLNLKISAKEEIKCKDYKEQTRDAYDNFGQFSFQQNASQINQSEKEQRERLLDKVNESWLKGFLDPSLYDAKVPIINPNRREVDLDLDASYKELSQTQIYEEIGQGRTLLILGEPGAGKTIALLQLAERLLKDSKKNSYLAMPVVFNLSSWEKQQKHILKWLIDELREKYQVPKFLSEPWIRNQQLILLLDGLDEVKEDHRNECICALNKFILDFPQTEVAVCSRTKEYKNLKEHLKLSSAFCLQPRSPEQVDHFLTEFGGDLASLKTLLRSDDTLMKFAQTPLILYFMSVAYQGASMEALRQKLQSTTDRDKNLFNDYINRKLDQDTTSEYSKYDVLRWLNWLANQMSQSVFQIEQLQPQCLPSKNDKIIYRIATFLILGVFLGLIAGTYFIYFYTAFPNNKPLPEFKILIQLIAIGLLSGLISGVIVGLLSLSLRYLQSNRVIKGLISGTIFALSISFFDSFLYQEIKIVPIYLSAIFGGAGFSSIDTSIKPVESIELDLNKMLKFITFFGIFGGGFSSITIYLDNPENFFTDKIYYSIYAIIIFMLVGLFVGGFRVRKNSIDIQRAIPNQGIKRSLRYTVITFCSLFITSIFVGWGMDFSFHFNPVLICLGLDVGLLGGLGANESSGVVCLQYFTLFHLLYKKGCIPKNYEKFLYFVSLCRFMNRIGGSYIFLHRMLLEHFKADEIGTR